jgi:hypothetical protein
MEQRHILEEIKRLASANSGKPPGRSAFEKATGIRESDWFPHYWLRWGDALKDAGFSPNRLNVPLDDSMILDQYVALVRGLGRLPVSGELRLRAKADPTFPSHNVFSKFGGKLGLIQRLRAHCAANPAAQDVLALLPPPDDRDGEEVLNERAPIQGYVYMMQSGRRYKIGFTNSPVRRHREVKIELPDPTDLVHSIETDDPKGIEAYWHRRFASKRVRDTEFFELDRSDVAAFKRRRYQ